MSGFSPERLIDIRERKGLSQSELGRRAGVGQSTINRLEQGETRNPRNLFEIAQALGTTEDYLMQRTDDDGLATFRGSPSDLTEFAQTVSSARDRRMKFEAAHAANDDDQVEIASIDFAYGFGGAYLDAGDPEIERVRFSRSWLRAQGIVAPPEVLGLAQGIGDSMEPLFYDRDVIVFDRSARLEDHMADKTWVFAFGQVGMVKRLRPMPDGTIKIMSANRTYPDEIAAAEEIYIIGRVVGLWRTY